MSREIERQTQRENRAIEFLEEERMIQPEAEAVRWEAV